MKLVFIKSRDLKEEPFTTSKVIAQYGQVNHDAVQRLIRNYTKDLKEFGKLGFEIRPLESGQSEKVYKLNEQQSTFLITLMKNSKQVVEFKKELVKQFFEMREELTRRRLERSKDKEQRNLLTEAIDRLPDTTHKVFKYRHYTELVYKTLFNKSSKELKIQFGIGKNQNVKDYFTVRELSNISKLEQQIATLIDMGLEYNEIKAMVQRKYVTVNISSDSFSVSN